ncbi:hypothetical protein CPB85DRAFT_1327302 [Mucidula mucida]|nr:hypothetical protein CPB85DRAFT_1327302 [Mucidula mucida]
MINILRCIMLYACVTQVPPPQPESNHSISARPIFSSLHSTSSFRYSLRMCNFSLRWERL